MHSIIPLTFISLLLISVHSLRITKIINATYSTGISFSTTTLITSDACVCSCVTHPHCLSMTVIKISSTQYICQLFATYPIRSSQLSLSYTSNVMIYTERTIRSVYVNNGRQLTNPTSLFSNNATPWIPAFKLFTGNNQHFLWFNSSNLNILTEIPKISIDRTESHWFNILLSQWNNNSYIPNQVAIAFIVNRTNIFEFLIFNSSQSNISAWFSISHFVSSTYWSLSQYHGLSYAQTQMKAVYSDNSSIRSFNANFKATNGCSQDFLGFFFVYGGYRDTCLAALRNMSQVLIPTIFYGPTTNVTNGSLDSYNIADGIMGFVR